jgi:hypothetical protein
VSADGLKDIGDPADIGGAKGGLVRHHGLLGEGTAGALDRWRSASRPVRRGYESRVFGNVACEAVLIDVDAQTRRSDLISMGRGTARLSPRPLSHGVIQLQRPKRRAVNCW